MPPAAKVDADAANALSQLMRAASPAQMDLR
jgi:hypothetical protein